MTPLQKKLEQVDKFFRSAEWYSKKNLKGCAGCQKLYNDVQDADTNTTFAAEDYCRAYDAVLKFATEHFNKEHKK